MKKSLFIISLLLVSCGGGNSSETQSPQNKIFSLEKINSLTLGKFYSSELVDTNKSLYGFISIENQPEKVVNGVMVTPQYRSFTYSHSRFGSGNISAPKWETTFNIDTATKNLISFTTFVSSSGMGPTINCVSSSPYHLPSQVKVGDNDSTPSFKCDNNINFDRGSWSAEDAGNGNLNFVIRSKTIDTSSNIIDEIITYTIDSSGNIVSFQINALKSFSDK